MKRTLTPQFMGLGNLGEYEIECTEFTADTIKGLDEKFFAALADKINGQMHITESGKTFFAKVKERLPVKGKEEKQADYAERVYPMALEAAKKIGESFTIDFVEAFKTWATDVFAKRGASAKVKSVTQDEYNKMISVIARWASISAEGRAKFLAATKLADGTIVALASTYKVESVMMLDAEEYA